MRGLRRRYNLARFNDTTIHLSHLLFVGSFLPRFQHSSSFIRVKVLEPFVENRDNFAKAARGYQIGPQIEHHLFGDHVFDNHRFRVDHRRPIPVLGV